MTDPTPPHPFDAAVALTPLGDDRFAGATHPAWANMVGPFGGITAATMLAAPCRHPARLGEPVALTVNFAGPIADGAFEIHARAARTNRATQHWLIELSQAGEVAATATAVFAHRRDTWSATELAMPDVPPADAATQVPAPGRIVWANRYHTRFVRGGWPDLSLDAPLPDADTQMWVRDEPPRPLDACSLAAIADAFYPRIFRRRQRFAPIGTVTITTYFHADGAALAAQGARPVLACARGTRYVQGFFEQRAELWGDTGTLLATSVQSVYFKD